MQVVVRRRTRSHPDAAGGLPSLWVERHTTPTQPDHISVEPPSGGIEVIADSPDGQVIVHIPWDHAVDLSRRILQLARDHGNVR